MVVDRISLPARVLVLAAVAWLVGASGGCQDAAPTSIAEGRLSAADRAKVPADVLDAALGHGPGDPPVELVVAVRGPAPAGGPGAAGGTPTTTPGPLAPVKTALQRDLGPAVALVRDFEHLPVLVVRVDSVGAFTRLLADPRVVGVDRVRTFEANDTESLALIGQPAVAAQGRTGSGVAVAVIDTGVDYTRAAFGSCTGVNAPQGTCRVVHAQDFGTNDGALDTGSLHGTNVAGIVAATAPGARIVALDVFDGDFALSTSILAAIDFVVAQRTQFNIAAMNLSLGALNGTAPYTSPCTSDPMGVALASARDVGILSAVSTGNNGFTNGIASPACAPAAVSVAAVYDTSGFAISCPGGGFQEAAADRVTCFSNTSSFTTLAAPGSPVTAAGITMHGTSQASPHVAGAIAVLRAAFPTETAAQLVTRMTSTGAPVTRGSLTLPRLSLPGAAAGGCRYTLSPRSVDAAARPHSMSVALSTDVSCAWQAEAVGDFFSISPSSGTGPATLTLALGANGGAARAGTLRVIDGDGVVGNSIAVAQQGDASAPTGTVVLNVGAAATNTATVSVAITATDPNGVSQMCVTEATSCTTFEPFASSRSITLAATGTRTVRVFLRDAVGNTSTLATAPADDIIFDTEAPTGGALSVGRAIGQLNLSWTASVDALSGVSGYRVFANVGGSTTPSCTGTPAVQTSESVRTAVLATPGGVVVRLRVCPVDRAGNIGAGFIGSGTALIDSAPPTGTITVLSPTPGYTNVATVRVVVTATDPSTVTGVCVTMATTCTAFDDVPAATTVTRETTFSLPEPAGTKRLFLFLRDGAGNVSATAAASTAVVLDSAAPGSGTLRAVAGDRQATLTAGSVSDSPAGIAFFRIVRTQGTSTTPPTAPASCAPGIPSETATTTTFTVTGLTNRAVYAFRVCAVDRAGNVAVGATALVEPRAEFVAPTATVVVNDGAAATNSLTLSLRIDVTENVGLEALCVGFATTPCAPFVAVAPGETTATVLRRTVTLPSATAGTRAVFVTLRDVSGNTMARPAGDTIVLDQAPPTRAFVHINGNTGITNSTAATLRIGGTDPAGVASYCISNTAEACAPTGPAWLPTSGCDGQQCVFGTFPGSPTAVDVTVGFTLLDLPGVRPVFVTLRDALGNIMTTPAQRTVILDKTPPTGGALAVTPAIGALNLSWTRSTDENRVSSYQVFAGASIPPDCSGTPLATVTTRTLSHAPLENGVSVGYRICPVDRAGNVGDGFVGQGTPRVELDGPVGVATINGGAAYTNTPLISVAISATDASGVAGLCIAGSTSGCTTTFEPYDGSSTTRPFTVSRTGGVRTVFVFLRDTLGNVSSTSASIIMDRVAPTGGTLTATPAAGAVALQWSATDPAGIRGYRLVSVPGTTLPAASCATGTTVTVLSVGPATSMTHTGLAPGTYSYRVCAEDNAGNVAAGATATVTVTSPAGTAGCGRSLLSSDFQDNDGDGDPDGETTLVVDGRTRRAAIRVPADYDPTSRYALVYELHGDQDAGTPLDPSTFTQGIFGADEYDDRAIVIALRGENLLAPVVRDDFAAFVSWDTLSPPEDNLDIDALRAFRSYVEDRACLEPGQVFAVGFSGGGFLAQTMRCFGEDFTAIANFQSGLDLADYAFLRDDSGALLSLDTAVCDPTPVPQLVVHLTGDAAVVVGQGIDTADFWATRHGCSPRADAAPSLLDDACVEYAGCGVDEDVVLCTPDGGGHEVWSPNGAQVLRSFFARFF
jgi:poly(3-hydroxybutyrate) depolymerase